MAVYVSNITIEQGFDFDTSFQLEDTRTNEFLDLTGASTSGMLRKHSASKTNVAFATTIANAETGIISISLTASNTVNLKPGRYVYDVLVSSGNTVYNIVNGNVLVKAGIATAP